MRGRLRWLWILALTVGGCKPPVYPSGTHGKGPWDVSTKRTITYDVTLARGGSAVTEKSTLQFLGGGSVAVSVNGAKSGPFKMSSNGRIDGPVPAYLGLLATMPPVDALMKSGSVTTMQFPSAKVRAANPNTITYGATVNATVRAAGNLVDISLDGTVGLVDNAGSAAALSAFLGDDPIPEVAQMAQVLKSNSPYLAGTAKFDKAAGNLVALDAYVLEFPLHTVQGKVEAMPNAVRVQLQQEGR